ncbi:FmtA-like protein [Ruegeria denitrificans]|uniref:FmtA-like protein n=1 Tax=Ruegeria denitrificans TaxID=1715692 RepID=A0A0P1I4W4_9RHOB|nr:serine hydrolase domain-containing protein [Ruegeria denitrificans]CUJ90085.1 FmtA-like protein [Ruegeria denitrificans]
MFRSRKARLRWSAGILVLAGVIVMFVERSREPATVEDIVESFLQSHNIPGAVLAYGPLGADPKIVPFGVSDPILNTPMTPDQPFRLASLTKPIAARALIEAEKRGQIDLNRLIAELAELPPPHDPQAAQITARQLLAHTGGFDKDITFDPIFAPERLGLDWSASCAEVAQTVWQTMPLDHAPGTRTAYSNVGFCLLTDLLTSALGSDIEDGLQQVADVYLEGPAGANWLYGSDGWTRVLLSDEVQNWILGLGIAGGAIGTAEAIWTFASTPQPVFETTALEDDKSDFYASGWHVWPEENGQHLTHWGGVRGLFTAVFQFSDGETVAILFNASPAEPSEAFTSLHNALYRINKLNR